MSTNCVSPQFHVVFDDHFSTIYNDSHLDDTKIEAIFSELFETCREYYGEQPLQKYTSVEATEEASDGQPLGEIECTDCVPELDKE